MVSARTPSPDGPAYYCRLHEQIEDFVAYLTPTPAELRMRRAVVADVEDTVHRLWPKAEVRRCVRASQRAGAHGRAQVVVFGSMSYGLMLPTSDVDLVVFGKWPRLPLRTLSRALEDTDFATNVQVRTEHCAASVVRLGRDSPPTSQVIAHAKVPIVKIKHSQSQVAVDICFNQESGRAVMGVVHEQTAKFPALRPLTLVVKHFLHEVRAVCVSLCCIQFLVLTWHVLLQRALNEVFTGGLSSYGTLLLVLSFLQQHPRAAVPGASTNLGVLLMEFCELYGRHFNYSRVAIWKREGGRYEARQESRRWHSTTRPGTVVVENPLAPGTDVTGGSYNMPMVRRALEHAYYVLTTAFVMRSSHQSHFCSKHHPVLLGRVVTVSPEIASYRRWVAATWGEENGTATTE